MGVYLADTGLFCLTVLPVPGPGFRGRFLAGFGHKADVNGLKFGPFATALRQKLAQKWPRKLTLGVQVA